VVPLVGLAVIALVAGVTAWTVTNGNGGSTSTARGAACRPTVDATGGPITVGSKIPDFELPTLDGGCVRLASYRGRPVVINFWASWCNPCRREFPLFRDALARHGDDRLEILGVAHDDIASDARRFARQRGTTWPLLLDENDDVANAFGVKPIPQTFFVRPNGTLASRLYGLTSERELEDEIARSLRP
jgi:cytochrome c biogenesis protein CcmG/thiol:disulfide interchange protein DsbE